jgi:type I restriction enzyme M protein
MLDERFGDGEYLDVPGLCKLASIDEIEEQGWSLNPGRYVGVAEEVRDEIPFGPRFAALVADFRSLSSEAEILSKQIIWYESEVNG